MLSRVASLSLLLALTTTVFGQDKTPAPEKLRQIATDAMKKSDVKDARIVDSDNLIVGTTLAESKAKALADTLQKTYLAASKVLKFQEEEIKSTRIIVYTFAELDNFKQFQRSILKVRPDADEFATFDIKADIPFIAVSVRRGDKNANFESLAANEVCRALLSKKGGNARLTEWMKDGFARAVQMRINPGSVGSDRSTVQRMAPRLAKTAKATPVVDKAWSGTGKDKDLVAASLMDFLTYGPGAEKLDGIINSMIPTGGNDNPSFGAALMAVEWMLEDLDRAWRDWLAKGSPANKEK